MAPGSALAKLRNIRKNKISRLETYDDEETVDDIYIDVEEEEYQKLQNQRIRDNFVQDDDGLGYADDGTYELEQLEEQQEITPLHKSRKRKAQTSPTDPGITEGRKDGSVSKMLRSKPVSSHVKAGLVDIKGNRSIDNLINSIGSSSSKRSPATRLGINSALRAPVSESSRITGIQPSSWFGSPLALRSSGLTGSVNTVPRATSHLVSHSVPHSASHIATTGPPVPAPVFRAQQKPETSETQGEYGVLQASLAPIANMADPTSSDPTDMGSAIPSSPPRNLLEEEDELVARELEAAESPLVHKLPECSEPSSLLTPAQSEDLGELLPEPETNLLYAPKTSSKVKLSSKFTPDVIAPNKVASFYWTDYCTTGENLLLFGRFGKDLEYESVAVQLKGLYREVHFLPREGYSLEQVREELEKSLMRFDFPMLSRQVEKKYCFGDQDVPATAQYLQVRVPFSISTDELIGSLQYGCYSKAFGVDSTMFERFSVGLNIMGPCWLTLTDATVLSGGTNCQNTIVVTKPTNVSVDKEKTFGVNAEDMPPVTVMTFALRTITNPTTNKPEIVGISARFYKFLRHDTITPANKIPSILVTGVRPTEKVFPQNFLSLIKRDGQKTGHNTVHAIFSEKQLLSWFIDTLAGLDPDIIVGHQLENIHLSILLARMKELGVENWALLGRRGRGYRPPQRVDIYSLRDWLPGRLLCDMANEMGKSITAKCDSWTLTEMVELYLRSERQDYDLDITHSRKLIEGADGLLFILRHLERDTLLISELALRTQVLSLSKQLTTLAGNAWSKTLSGSRVDRNEFILLHEFTRQGYVVPNRNKAKSNGRQKAKYAGGKVFEPERGLYRTNVLVMDFNSLYPSIIQEFNICFTTINHAQCKSSEELLPELPDRSVPMGLFPQLIQSLVSKRREVKKLMKNPRISEQELAQYDTRQQALKLTANSMYGCLGFAQSRFYALPLAMLTTSKGREILEQTKSLAEKSNLQVVYGDTDSVMINTNVTDYQKTIEIGEAFKKQINEQYRMLEIDIDNVFSALLLAMKKKYAAVNVIMQADHKLQYKIEVKGMDLKRREFCKLSKMASLAALDFILLSKDLDEALEKLHAYLEELGQKLKPDQPTSLPLSQFIIRNKLSKLPREYSPTEQKRMPHVIVALKKQEQGETVSANDVIDYVITRDPNDPSDLSRPFCQRACTVSEMGLRKLEIDTEFYLLHQILPPLERICIHVPGTDKVRIAKSLGIDVEKHKLFVATQHQPDRNNSRVVKVFDALQSDAERFKSCQPFALRCGCGNQFQFRGIQDPNLSAQGITCPKCHAPISGLRLHAQLENQIRKEINRYYLGIVKCNEDSCGLTFREVGVYGVKCFGMGGNCQGRVSYVYDSKDLYTQLSYFASMFDMERISARKDQFPASDQERIGVLAKQNLERFLTAKSLVQQYLDKNGRGYVNMRKLFALA